MKLIQRTYIAGFLVLSLLTTVSPCAFATELTPLEIVRSVRDRYDGDTVTSNMTMILIDKRNNKRVRKMKSLRKDDGTVKKTITFFLSPANVKNTTFLSFDWESDAKDDDNWLYLPALRKVKRISAGNKKDPFMGSDFSYADMNSLNVEDWSYQFVKKSEIVAGHDCWVISAIPIPSKKKKVLNETGYLKRQSWIRKDIFIVIKGKIWVKKDNKVKYFTAKNIEKIKGIWTAKTLTMVTTKRKRKEHATVILFDNFKYNKELSNHTFTTQRMERGL